MRSQSSLLGIPINDFVVINFNGFTDIVNKLGGAYLMIDHSYYNNTAVTDYASIDIQPGYQRLNGANTLSWVRYRHDQNGDFTRIVRQQIFLREMKREVMGSAKLTSLPRFLSVMTILSHNVVTDISSLSKLYSLLALILQINTTHIYQTHIAGSTPTINGVDYVSASPQQVATAVQQFLHPVAAPKQRAAKTAAPKITTPQSARGQGRNHRAQRLRPVRRGGCRHVPAASPRLRRPHWRQCPQFHLQDHHDRRRSRVTDRGLSPRRAAGAGAPRVRHRLGSHHRDPGFLV